MKELKITGLKKFPFYNVTENALLWKWEINQSVQCAIESIWRIDLTHLQSNRK